MDTSKAVAYWQLRSVKKSSRHRQRSVLVPTLADTDQVPLAKQQPAKLPAELLCKIFQECIDDEIRAFRDQPPTAQMSNVYSFFALRQVCSSWRITIDGSPLLWTKISTVTLTKGPYAQMGPNILQEFLDKSCSLPLMLYIENPWIMGELKAFKRRVDYFKRFLPHLERCSHLELRLHREIFNYFLELDLSVVSNSTLSSVVLRGECSVATGILVRLFEFGDIRRLEMDLEGVIITEEVPWSNLTHMSVDNHILSYEAGVELLLRCRNVESIALRISCFKVGGPEHSHRIPVITFPNMLSLKLVVDKAIAYVVQAIVAPKLRVFHLGFMSFTRARIVWGTSLLTQFLGHAHSLEDVEIVDLCSSVDFETNEGCLDLVKLCFARHIRAFGLVVSGYPVPSLESLGEAVRGLKETDFQPSRQLFFTEVSEEGRSLLKTVVIRWDKAVDIAKFSRSLAYDARLHFVKPKVGWWEAGSGLTRWISKEEWEVFERKFTEER